MYYGKVAIIVKSFLSAHPGQWTAGWVQTNSQGRAAGIKQAGGQEQFAEIETIPRSRFDVERLEDKSLIYTRDGRPREGYIGVLHKKGGGP